MDRIMMTAVQAAVAKIAEDTGESAQEAYGESVFAFLAPPGLCLIGVREWYEDEGYVDMVWRHLLGEVTAEFDWAEALKQSHTYSETPYGLTDLGGRRVFSTSDRFRLLFQWGPERIARLIYMRYGGQLALNHRIAGVRPLPRDFYGDVMSSNDLRDLLQIPRTLQFFCL